MNTYPGIAIIALSTMILLLTGVYIWAQSKRQKALEAENRALLTTVLSLSGKPQAAEVFQHAHRPGTDQRSDFQRLEDVPQARGRDNKPLGL